MDYRALSTELNRGEVASCYLFIAYDRYIAKAYVRLIKGMILTGELADMNCRVFDDKKVDARVLAAELNAMPMMAEKRMVVIDSDSFGAVTQSKELSGVLENFISSDPSHICLVCITPKMPDKRTKLYSALSSHAKIVEMKRYDEKGLSDYISNRLKASKLSISKEALEWFLDAVDYTAYRSETDLGYVVNELDKITAWCRGKKTVSLEDVKAVCAPTVSRDISRYTDSVLRGDMKSAMEGMNDLRTLRTGLALVMYSLDGALRQNALMMHSFSQGMTESEVAKKLGKHPYVIKLARKNNALDLEGSLRGIGILGDTDRRLKRGLLDDESAFILITRELTALAADRQH